MQERTLLIIHQGALGDFIATFSGEKRGHSIFLLSSLMCEKRGQDERDDGEKLIFKPPIIDFGKAFMIKTRI